MTVVPVFPVDQWRELLQALCRDDPAAVGAVTAGEAMTVVGPTCFDWLSGFSWRPVGDDFGIAILDLANAGGHPPTAWQPVCGPLVRSPMKPGAGPVLQGLVEFPDTSNRAAVYLTTDLPPDDPAARVTEVVVRIEPV